VTPATAPPATARSSYVFGDFVLDGARCELRRRGTRLAVEPKVFDLLLWLAAHRERVVTHDELFSALWPGQRVGEEALTYCVKAARRAVDDSGATQHTITTVRGHGYRFVADALEHALAGAPRHDSHLPSGAPASDGEGFFVGREPVMARLRGALAAATSGQGRIALLSGEPGIGKTRTADELARSAVRQGAEVLVGRCHEGAGAPPFWPWVQILRAWVAVRDRAAVRAVVGERSADLAPLVPDLTALRDAHATQPPETDDARFRMFDAAASFLVRAAQSRPLVLILDDLHWADTPSLLLLQFLAHEIGNARLLVIGTVRDTDVAADHPLNACIAALARGARLERIQLAGLTASDVGLLIEAATGELPAAATARAVHQQTGGNPFFVTETVRLLLADGVAAATSPKKRAHVPGSVRAVVRQRLESLPVAARGVLRVAAVFGQEFDSALVARVSDGGRRPARARLLDGLDEAVRAHLVEPQPETPGGYRFAHALVRETIYDDLPSGERARLHERVGAAIAAEHASDPGPQLASLAHHFGAAVAGDSRRAIRYAIAAGDRAARMLAWEEATAHHAHALELLARSSAHRRRGAAGSVKNTDGDVVDVLLFQLGENLWKSGELERAKEMFRRAAVRARAHGSATRLARAALGFGGGFRGFELGEVEPELIALLEEALRALPRRPTGLRARLTARLAVALYHVPDSLARRQTLSQQAVRMAARTSDTAAELAALYGRHGAIWGPDTLRDRIDTAEAMRHLAAQVGDREAALHAHRFHLIDSLELGDLAAADADLQACVRLGEELNQPYYVWYAASVRAIRLLLEGRLSDSERLAGEALAAGRRAQSRNVEQVHASQLLWIRREQGRLAEVEPTLRELVERFPTLPVWRCAYAFVLAERGRTTEARVYFERLAAGDFATIARDAFWLSAMCALADVCAELGDVARAAVLHRLLEPYRGRIVQVSIGAGCLGAVERPLGRLAALLERWDDAAAHFAAALHLEQLLRAPLLAARTRQHHAAALLARGRARDAREALRHLAHADAAYRSLGVPRERVAALRARATAVAGRASQPAPARQEQRGSHALGKRR